MDTTNHCQNCEALAMEKQKEFEIASGYHRCWQRTKAENEELRKAVARKDEALNEIMGLAHVKGKNLEDAVFDSIWCIANRGISSAPSGMVCVSKELGPELNRVARLLWGEDKYWPNVIAELAALIGGDDDN